MQNTEVIILKIILGTNGSELLIKKLIIYIYSVEFRLI